MSRTRRLGRLGGLAAVAAAATPFAGLWLVQVRNADDPMTVRTKLDVAIWMAVFAMPWMLAAWLLWRAWWRRAGATVSEMDGPARLLATAAATLPADRREWGAAMTAELTQVRDHAARWRFAAGGARAAVFPPAGDRAAAIAAGTIAVASTATATLAAVKLVPAGRVFAPAFVGLLGGLATLAVARPRRDGRARPGQAVAGLALAGDRRPCRGHHLVPGRVPLDAPRLPSHHLGDPPAGDGGRPGRSAGRLPVAGSAPAALAGW